MNALTLPKWDSEVQVVFEMPCVSVFEAGKNEKNQDSKIFAAAAPNFKNETGINVGKKSAKILNEGPSVCSSWSST